MFNDNGGSDDADDGWGADGDAAGLRAEHRDAKR